MCHRWGIRTLGEFGALPAADLSSRLGPQALAWQAFARGEDAVPLVPTLPAERFESSLELDWPIEGLEPLSFVLTRLLEPLSVRLERRDRGTAILHLELRLVTKEVHARHLQLPSPIRDVRTLRTLLLLDLDSHPPPAAIDCVTIQIDPTPGRVVQHTLFTRAQPTPEQLSTLVARLNALMGQDRIGAPATVDSHRPGAFEMKPFAIERDHDQRRARRDRREIHSKSSADAVHRDGQAPEPPAPSPCSPRGVVAAAVSSAYSRAGRDRSRPPRATDHRPPRPGGRSCRDRGRPVADVRTLVGGRGGKARAFRRGIGPARPASPALLGSRRMGRGDRRRWRLSDLPGSRHRSVVRGCDR